ncbi:MAG: hypothetical protein FIA99_14750 [Ruminiclostridium sp.]|nr:hypothetical protein [Ruminiclostridium sp.]
MQTKRAETKINFCPGPKDLASSPAGQKMISEIVEKNYFCPGATEDICEISQRRRTEYPG